MASDVPGASATVQVTMSRKHQGHRAHQQRNATPGQHGLRQLAQKLRHRSDNKNTIRFPLT
jgi:hypothetical protein